MNNKMSGLLHRAGLRWPVAVHPTPAQLPTLEISGDCVLLKKQWEPNKHVKIANCFDKTGFECFTNHVHLPFSGADESLISVSRMPQYCNKH
jgi:hypothetical protein